MFTMLLEREARINFNYNGHIKWNLSKCVGGFTQCCCPEGTGKGSGHIWLAFQLMLSCPCPVFQHPPFCPFTDLHSGLCPPSGSYRRQLESGWDGSKAPVSPVALSTTFSRCSPTLRSVWGHISDLKQWFSIRTKILHWTYSGGPTRCKQLYSYKRKPNVLFKHEFIFPFLG